DTNIVSIAQEQGLYNERRTYGPFEFQLVTGRVITGWHLGLEGLPVGTKATLLIPSSLGYGVRGNGASIPPNSPLRFDVEILSATAPF
ncbi:MAG: FKBP-type peptidyl-prolyl cis-trans isomerase, partial [Bacteroidota bacterium]